MTVTVETRDENESKTCRREGEEQQAGIGCDSNANLCLCDLCFLERAEQNKTEKGKAEQNSRKQIKQNSNSESVRGYSRDQKPDPTCHCLDHTSSALLACSCCCENDTESTHRELNQNLIDVVD